MANKSGRKAAPPKDFAKKQVRVGRLKPGAANATNTSFAAKKVLLKDQAIPDEALIQARRNDALAKMTVGLAQLAHYSASFRREAVANLGKALRTIPDIELHVIGVAESLVRTIVDDDASVRQGALSVWAWMFNCGKVQRASGSVLAIVVPYLSLGLTHLNKATCADTARLLALVVDSGQAAIRPFLADILPLLAKHFSAKSFDHPKRGDIDLVALFCKCVDLLLLATSNPHRSPIEYAWQPVQTASLRPPPRTAQLKLDSISSAQVDRVLQSTMAPAIQVWSQVGYIIVSPGCAMPDKEEAELFKRCLSVLKACNALCKSAEVCMDGHVFPKLRQSLSWTSLIAQLNK